jgi:hypothetical protein
MDHHIRTEIKPLGELIYKFIDVHQGLLPGAVRLRRRCYAWASTNYNRGSLYRTATGGVNLRVCSVLLRFRLAKNLDELSFSKSRASGLGNER